MVGFNKKKNKCTLVSVNRLLVAVNFDFLIFFFFFNENMVLHDICLMSAILSEQQNVLCLFWMLTMLTL